MARQGGLTFAGVEFEGKERRAADWHQPAQFPSSILYPPSSILWAMPLPVLIEIVPLKTPVRAEITVPGSKSITNRALILGALADGEAVLQNALWSEDTQVMVEALRTLGFEVKVAPDPEEFCNRTITVKGLGGKIPHAGTADKPLELFVGNAGTAARFLSALVCLGKGVYRLHGTARMHERPQAALFTALRELGYRVDSKNDKLPATIHGDGPHPGAKCAVSIAESSQFASALLLAAKNGAWRIEETGENTEESPYVIMTLKLVDAFPKQGGRFAIEPDASSGSYFWAAGWLVAVSAWMSEFLKACGDWKPEDFSDANVFSEHVKRLADQFHSLSDWFYGAFHPSGPHDYRRFPIRVGNWPTSGWQVDADFPQFLPLPERISREGQLGDSIMTAIVLAADQWGGWAKKGPVQDVYFTHLGRLRVQETERVLALRTELTKCGARVNERGDTLTIYPSKLHGAEIETYEDHRMAMCFAILGLKVPGIKIRNPACVKKTFPDFFQKLAAPPPKGLGAEIRDVKTGRRLELEELFAD